MIYFAAARRTEMARGKLIGKIEAAARRRRNTIFFRLIESLERPITILDVGGTVEYWRTLDLPGGVAKIVLLNTFPQRASAPFEVIVGDACDLSRYSDRQFDLVFSNSVIGHVGSFGKQQRMASEIRRVGRYFFLQTPNHGFPVD
jgi:hypothetical protein